MTYFPSINRNELIPTSYTCNEYREEMILLALRRKLHNSDLPEKEKAYLKEEISRLEEKIGF